MWTSPNEAGLPSVPAGDGETFNRKGRKELRKGRKENNLELSVCVGARFRGVLALFPQFSTICCTSSQYLHSSRRVATCIKWEAGCRVDRVWRTCG
jgi:hypothetical protein